MALAGNLIVTIVGGAIALVAGTWLIEVMLGRRKYAYVFMKDGQPLRNGVVANGDGHDEPVSTRGKFKVRRGWGQGTVLHFYSQNVYCGQASLQEVNGEFEAIHLKVTAEQAATRLPDASRYMRAD